MTRRRIRPRLNGRHRPCGWDKTVHLDQRHDSHGTLHCGNRKTTLQDLRKEIGPGLLHRMLGQLGLGRWASGKTRMMRGFSYLAILQRDAAERVLVLFPDLAEAGSRRRGRGRGPRQPDRRRRGDPNRDFRDHHLSLDPARMQLMQLDLTDGKAAALL
jgi:hypothetical protein